MLDQLEMARRRYEQIAPDAGAEMTQDQADQLVEWLELQVGEIVASLLARPGFRCRARWPIDRLTGELDCPERAAVLAVDDALVRYARALSEVARAEAVWHQLLRIGHPQDEVAEGDESVLAPVSDDETLPPMPLDLQHVEFLAERPWRDLASAWDYFHPVSQFNLQEQDCRQWADFLPYVNRRLRVPGDYVTRCLEIRVDTWLTSLQRFWVRCDTARQLADADLGTQWDQLSEIRSELCSRFEALRVLCFRGQEARVRDSCIALLQIYTGIHQDADVSWLGPVARMAENAADIPHRVARMHQWDVPERAAAALVDIANLVRRPQTPEDVIEENKATKRLVLVEEQREGFLDGRSIDRSERTNWHMASLQWELLWTLADRALLRRSVDPHCLSNPKASEAGEPPSGQAIKDRRNHLKQLILPELNDLIVDAGQSTYRLELEPDQICLLGWFTDEQLVELEPNAPRH